jgi:hypothetical protein
MQLGLAEAWQVRIFQSAFISPNPGFAKGFMWLKGSIPRMILPKSAAEQEVMVLFCFRHILGKDPLLSRSRHNIPNGSRFPGPANRRKINIVQFGRVSGADLGP